MKVEYGYHVYADEVGTEYLIEMDINLHRKACHYSLNRLLGIPVDDQQNQLLLNSCNKLDQLQSFFYKKSSDDHFHQTSSNIESWLFSNGLESSNAKILLNNIQDPNIETAIASKNSASTAFLPIDSAWSIATIALRGYLPAIANIINQVSTDAGKDLSPGKIKHPLPFTHDMGWERLPFVSVHYQGTAADLLCIAHEMAHAVQLVASQRSNEFYSYDMPSISRECCAFIGELALLQYLKDTYHPLSTQCHATWEIESKTYSQADKFALLSALESNTAEFSYRWNYPVARFLASIIWQQVNTTEICKLFSAGQSADVPFLESLFKGGSYHV